jgi:2-polyprenyl-3-methyl-5-hydroxy-6-metoxy-1,4-benzoquinol methylase
MQLKQRNTCPLCQSGHIELFKEGTFDPGTLAADHFKITDSHYGSLWTFFRCSDCHFVFSNPYLPEENLVEFYTQLEDREYSEEAEGRSRNFKTILARLKRLKPGNTLLDIGAASGIFLDLARQQGYHGEGIEPSTSLVNEAEQRRGLHLFNGTAAEYIRTNTGKTFSIITLLDIIEHLVEPDEFMAKLDNLIEDNGILVLVTPDIDSLTARILGNRWWHYRIAHIQFFNRAALEYLLEKHHYEIVARKRYVWNFTLFYLVTRIFPSLGHKKPLQKVLKRLHLKLPLFDSWEIYARKRKQQQKV